MTSVPPTCPLCLRPIPPDVPQTMLQLVPKLKGGAKVLLHHICHREIHARFSEAELGRKFPDIEGIRADPRLEAFLDWIAKRPPDFTVRVENTQRRRH